VSSGPPSRDVERIPPHSLEAEQSILGAMLLDREAVAVGCEVLKPGDFYRDAHGALFEAMRGLFQRLEPVDLVTISAELMRQGAYDRVGGGEYLAALAASVPTARNAAHYAEIVRDTSHLRRLLGATTRIANLAYDSHDDARAILDKAEAELLSVTQLRISGELVAVRDLLYGVQKEMEARQTHRGSTGLRTGLKALDDIIVGLQPGDLFILAARPSMGKTSLAMNMATHIALRTRLPDRDNPDQLTRQPVVAVFSLEMSKESLVESMLCAEAHVDANRVRKGNFPRELWERIGIASGNLYDAQLLIDDTPGLSPLEIRAKARRLHATRGLDAVFVDYLQRMTPHRSYDSENLAVGAMAREMKTLARELEVPVICLSQLSRRVEQRTTNPDEMRPMLSDLLASGMIEAEADVIAFLYRPEYYRQLAKKDKGDEEQAPRQETEGAAEEAEVIIGKHRNGPTGIAKIAFRRHFRRFEDWAPSQYREG
jgi:replicative DNA helicase